MGDSSAGPLAVPPTVALALAGAALAAAALFLLPAVERRIRALDAPVSPATTPVLRRLAPQPPYSDAHADPGSADTVTPGSQVVADGSTEGGLRVGPVHASHRGGAKAWPENTLLAFRSAAGIPLASPRAPGKGDPPAPAPACQARMIELDVQLTRDGHLVVIHNLTVDSTTDGKGLVSSFSLEELRRLDAGYRFWPSHPPPLHSHSQTHSEGVGGADKSGSGSEDKNDKGDSDPFFPYRNQGIQIPLLSEALEVIAAHDDLVLYLDFKTPEAIKPALVMAEQYGLLKDRTIVGAVPPAANQELLRVKPPHVPATPDINTMIGLYILYILNLMWLAPLRHEIVGTTVYRWGMKVLDSRLIRAFRRRGRLLAVFGDSIDGAEGQRECLEAGCDFLVSDRPDILWETMKAWRADGCPREA